MAFHLRLSPAVIGCRAPHEPKSVWEKCRVELFGNAGATEQALGFYYQTLDGQVVLFVKPELWCGLSAAIAEETRFGSSLRGLVPPQDFLSDRLSFIEGWDRGKQLEGAELLALQHPAATQHISSFGLPGAIQAATDLLRLLQDRDVLAEHVAIADHDDCRGQ